MCLLVCRTSGLPGPNSWPLSLSTTSHYRGGGRVSTYRAVERATSVAKIADGVGSSTLAEFSDFARESIQESMQKSYTATLSCVAPWAGSHPTTSSPHGKLSASRTARPVVAPRQGRDEQDSKAGRSGSCHGMLVIWDSSNGQKSKHGCNWKQTSCVMF